VEALGPEQLVHVDVRARPVVNDEVLEGSVVEADDEEIVADLRAGSEDGTASLVARVPPATPVETGGAIAFDVALGGLQFFELDTGNAIR